jgi:anthranilate phosphoribosyltransferase
MRFAVPVRRDLGVVTVFNFLGPLANPARARYQLVGVSDPSMAEKMMGVLMVNGARRAMVVHGVDGLDELSTTAPSKVLEFDARDDDPDAGVRSYVVDPVDLGLPRATLSDLRGGDAGVNAQLARRVLAGETGPHRDVVVLNAAAALMVAGLVDGLAEGVAMAGAVIDDGRARSVLDRLVEVSQEAAAH